jgi:nitrite reductase/ring-hydroxylating ferredoxin subunit
MLPESITTMSNQSSAMRVRIGPESELEPGERKCLSIDGTEIVVINLDGEYFAVRSFCPHMGGPVGRGATYDENPSAPKATESTRSGCDVDSAEPDGGQTIACPFHGWRFEVETGASTFSEKKRVRTYEVETVNDEIYVDV